MCRPPRTTHGAGSASRLGLVQAGKHAHRRPSTRRTAMSKEKRSTKEKRKPKKEKPAPKK
jgi:hypothetical protein